MKIVCVALIFAFAFLQPIAVRAQPAPDGTPCSVPDRPPGLVHGVAAVTPPIAIAQHISGEVVVVVTLDENSNVVAAAIAKSPSALLNTAALLAARSSTFQVPVRNCKPMPGKFRFLVEFTDRTTEKPPAMAAFYTGTWSCRNDAGRVEVRTYEVSGGVLMSSVSDHPHNGDIGPDDETFSRVGSVIGISSNRGGRYYGGGMSNTATGPVIVFRFAAYIAGPSQPAAERILTFTQDDADHYTWTSVQQSGPPDSAPASMTSHCTRMKA
jgi:TonB family protein